MNIYDLHEQFCDYQITIRNFQPITIKNYKNTLHLFSVFLPHITELEQVTRQDVNQFFFIGRSQRQWRPATFITQHKNLSVFFKWCVKQGFILENPASHIEKPRREKRVPKGLNKQQAMVLLQTVMTMPFDTEFIRTRNHAIMAMFLYCGLRKGELLKLRLHQVDLTNMSVFVQQGKGSKDRMVPIPYPLKVIMDRYLAERDKLRKISDALFVSTYRDMPITDSTLKKLVDAIKKATGIYFHLHMLRHTFATLMLEGGCDIYSLSKMMGHADISTTTIYLSASVEHMRSEMMKHPLNF